MRWPGRTLAFGISALLAASTLAACASAFYPGGFITVPVRWCVMEGSSDSGTHLPGQTVALRSAQFAIAQETWASEAGIDFDFEQLPGLGVPVIRDTSPPPGDAGQLGDVDVSYYLEPSDEAFECRKAWAQLDPSAPDGIVGVTARGFVNGGQTLGVSSEPDPSLWVKQASPLTGKRGDDLCGDPRHLKLSDVDQAFVMLPQKNWFPNSSVYNHSLAHELGHALTLGHGNGIDDNGDGKPAGTPGPRRFDQYCDPLGTAPDGLPVEDHETSGSTCGVSESLMEPETTSCYKLSALQIEQARAVATILASATGPATMPSGRPNLYTR
jgi:hypothetical protein